MNNTKPYVEINLEKQGSYDNSIYKLKDLIDGEVDSIFVILGAPGCGKTSLLNHYKEKNNSKTQLLTVKDFLKLDVQIDESIDVLLLDGIDEYRSSPGVDKSYVLTEIGDKINNLKSINIVMTCREMDWYGEFDQNALNSKVQKENQLFKILPLNQEQKLELAQLLQIDNPNSFVEKFSNYGFLENPQMFIMVADIVDKTPEQLIQSKKELYNLFIKNAREKNQNNLVNNVNELSTEEIFKYCGYLATFYIFSDVDIFAEDFIDYICDIDNGFVKEKIRIVLNTNLFDDKIFIHRTIAEYACAFFINEHVLGSANKIFIKRVKELFIINNRVPTTLRGTFAWLCSITTNDELVKLDPYYQAIHGDNTLFDVPLKKKIVLSVKNYAETNPYFIEFNQLMELEGFYQFELDEFLFKEVENALNIKNHYLYFLISVIISRARLSSQMISFVKHKILDPSIKPYYKSQLIKALISDSAFLKNILADIKKNKLPDNNDELKDKLLWLLYPKYITSVEIAEYLVLYHNNYVGGYCYYLYSTVYEDKFKLIDNLYMLCTDPAKKPRVRLPKNVENFVEDYFLETVLYYEEKYTAKEIYDILTHFKTYYDWYEHLPFNSYRYVITEKKEKNIEKLIRLANELFSLYINDLIDENFKNFNRNQFSYLYNCAQPDNHVAILFSKMDLNNSKENNRILFLEALRYLESESIAKERLNKITKTYGLEEELKKFLNPQKTTWQIEDEQLQKKQEEETLRILNENEKYLSERTDEDIRKSFRDMYHISTLFFLDQSTHNQKHFKPATLSRLKKTLKESIYSEPIEPSLLTLQSLALSSPDARRNIDNLFYVAAQLNDNFDPDKINNKEFIKYLYINVLLHKSINILKGNFNEKIENNDPTFVCETIKEYIRLLIETYLRGLQSILVPYVNTEKNIDNLKYIIRLFVSEKNSIDNCILFNLLKIYNFSIECDHIKKILDYEFNDENILTLESILMIHENRINDFSINHAVSIYLLFEHKYELFQMLSEEIKISIIDFMIRQFNTEKSLEMVNGFQSKKDMCASFLRDSALKFLSIDGLKCLKKLHNDDDDIWKNRISNYINQFEQVDADRILTKYSVLKIKNFLLSKKIISNHDFFIYVSEIIHQLKSEIEASRDNEKKLFYNEGTVKSKPISRNEEFCRDIILQFLKREYGYDLLLSKEKYEEDNRVDLNIKYKADLNFEVQVECKKDKNSDIYTSIGDQLISKYLLKKVEYGIYLVFYFGEKKKEDLLYQLSQSLPVDYNNKIKIICIDLTF